MIPRIKVDIGCIIALEQRSLDYTALLGTALNLRKGGGDVLGSRE